MWLPKCFRKKKPVISEGAGFTFHDLETGNTPHEYILLCKDEGKYRLFTTSQTMQEIADYINGVMADAKKNLAKKNLVG